MIRTITLPPRRLVMVFMLLAIACVCVPAHAQLTVTISNYPRYATATLTPEQEVQMRSMARAIAGTLFTGANVAISIFGHADFDAQGRDFETRISEERARGAETNLRRMIREELANMALPTSRADDVDIVTLGLGTQRPVFPNPTDDERPLNRRAEFVFTIAAAPPPTQQMPRCQRLMQSASPAGPAKRMECVCNALQNPAVLDYAYDFDSAQRARNNGAPMKTWTPEQWHAFAQVMTFKLRRDIAAAGSNNSDDQQFVSVLKQIDDNVGRSIFNFEKQVLENAAAPDLFERVVNYDIGKRMNDPSHVYACYAGYSRRSHDQWTHP
jgi:hypothetical protein